MCIDNIENTCRNTSFFSCQGLLSGAIGLSIVDLAKQFIQACPGY